MLTEEQSRTVLEMQSRIDAANAQEEKRNAARMAEFETVETFIKGRKHFQLRHKVSKLGMWSHYVALNNPR